MVDSGFRRELGQQLRVDSVRVSARAGSGHPTSSMSAADLMAVLLDGHLRLNYDLPHGASWKLDQASGCESRLGKYRSAQ